MNHFVHNQKGGLRKTSIVDKQLALFMEEAYLNGEDISYANYMIAAVIHFNPALKSPAMSKLPMCKKSLKGWRNLCPTRSRLPIPWEVTALLVQDCFNLQKYHLAVNMLLMFALYLRPSEALRLRRKDIVPPVRGGPVGYRLWTVVLHPLELGKQSKTKEFDESLMLDLDYHDGIGPFLKHFAVTSSLIR